MTIHNLTPDANILFASDSIIDILGYHPDEVQGKSCFDYFHPEEVPFARSVHSRGVLLDKAAVLHYCRILSRDEQWVSCECCFTIVHDVLVACTSIYRRGERSQRRAIEAPQIRRIFSCSPRDPRYHMLEHLSPKFKMPPMEREPRAALILNRFTRNLTVMFATNAVSSIFGLRPDQIKNKSFYRCIQENCLPEALKCLESAKANDSIAYLRFWFRDPRDEEDFDEEEHDEGDVTRNGSDSSDSDGGGVDISCDMDIDSDNTSHNIKREESPPRQGLRERFPPSIDAMTNPIMAPTSHRTSSIPEAPRQRIREPLPSIELEAVVSCTSDGLVVVLRKARPPIPAAHPPLLPLDFENGLFAAPWGQQPIQPHVDPDMLYMFRPPLLPQYMPLRESVKAAGGPPLDQLMRSIRDVAVFAWALVGINGNLAAFSRGLPRGDASPPDGLPVWDPNAGNVPYRGPENQAALRWAQLDSGKAPPAASYLPPSQRADLSQGYGQIPQQSRDNYTYSTPTMWPGSTTPYSAGYERQQQQAMLQQATRHHQQPPPAYHGLPQQESWPEPSVGSPNFQASYVVPTTQSPSPNDTSQHYHYWK